MNDTQQPGSFHSVSAADLDATEQLRQQSAPMKGMVSGPLARLPFAALMEQTPSYAGVTYEAATIGGVAGWWCRPADTTAPDHAVLYLHGGAYVLGSAKAHRHFVGQLAGRARLDFFVADYRLGPEHPFPAAVDDALAAYQGLVDLGKLQVGIAGDSAGGGLALVTVAGATHRAANDPAARPPRAAVVFSPWTDLALTSASMQTRAAADPLLTQESLATSASYYLQGYDPHDPRASPVYGDLSGLPPTMVHVGEAEVLLDDAVRYVAKALAAGVAADLTIWQGMTHVFESSVQTLEAAKEALDISAAFLAGQLG